MPHIIHKTHPSREFSPCRNSLIEDTRLSPLARLLCQYAVSRPAAWVLNEADMRRISGCGRDAVHKAINSLVTYTYVTKEKQERIAVGEGSGKKVFAQVVYHWRDVPSTEFPSTEFPSTEVRSPEVRQRKSGHRKTAPTNTDITNTDITNTEVPSFNSSREESQSGCPQCRSPKKADHGTDYLMQQAHDLYREKVGECWTQSYPQGATGFKGLLTSGKTEAAILAVYRKYLTLDDEWFVEHGYSLAWFFKQYDGIKMRSQDGRNRRNYQEPYDKTKDPDPYRHRTHEEWVRAATEYDDEDE